MLLVGNHMFIATPIQALSTYTVSRFDEPLNKTKIPHPRKQRQNAPQRTNVMCTVEFSEVTVYQPW